MKVLKQELRYPHNIQDLLKLAKTTMPTISSVLNKTKNVPIFTILLLLFKLTSVYLTFILNAKVYENKT